MPYTHSQEHSFYFLLGLIALTAVFVFFIFQPFLYVLVLAMVFAVVFQPLYGKILKAVGGREAIAAFIAAAIIIIVIFTPLIMLGRQVFQEVMQVYVSISNDDPNSLIYSGEKLWENIAAVVPIPAKFSFDIGMYMQQGAEWLIGHLSAVFSSFVRLFLNAVIFFIALYYMLKDGTRFKDAVVAWSPLKDSDDAVVLSKLERAVRSVVQGKLLLALIQGALTAIGFWLFGVPNAALWGSVAAVAALIPAIGTALVLAPAIIFLFLSGQVGAAVGLLVWSVAVVGIADNVLGPRFMGRGLQLHALAILLSVLGGIAFFGPIGFILGPLMVSLFFALLDIYFAPFHI